MSFEGQKILTLTFEVDDLDARRDDVTKELKMVLRRHFGDNFTVAESTDTE